MDGKVIIGTELDTKEFDAQIDYIEKRMQDIEDTLKKADMGFEVGDVGKLEAEYEKLGNQLLGLREKQKKYNQAINEVTKQGFSNLTKQIDGIGKSTQKVIKKVARWGLAIFGIRSAYMFVRNAINTIAGDDEQLKADIDYMKSAIAYSIEPLVRGIVNLAKQLLFYIQYIVQAWTGKNIFANANKGLDSANKKAKELKKTTSGFDELNVLSDTSGTSQTTTPSFDLSQIQGEVPGWLQFIVDNGPTILGVIGGIVAGITTFKIESMLAGAGIIDKASAIESIGIGAIIAGAVMLVQDIIDMINDPSWENFIAILGDIAIIIGGIMLVMGNWWGLLVVIIGLIVKLVAENWDKVKEILGKVGTWIYDHVIKPVKDFFAGLWDGIKSSFIGVWEFIKKAFSKGGQLFNGLKDGIVNVFKTIVNTLINGINRVVRIPFDLINGLLNKIRNISILGFTPFQSLWKENPLPVPQIPKLAKGGIINQPGRGVMVGSAIAGEKGAEGVIPLTDSQQMALLGEAIGKYITINAEIINTMNGRVISRELQRVQNESDFAYNR